MTRNEIPPALLKFNLLLKKKKRRSLTLLLITFARALMPRVLRNEEK